MVELSKEDAIEKIRERKKYLVNLIKDDLKYLPDDVGIMAKMDANLLIEAINIL